jgi:hypothetical protein
MNPQSKIPSWLDRQTVAQIILVILFLALCVWISVQPNPFDIAEVPPQPQANSQHPLDPTSMMLQATAYRTEIEENRDQTLGIVFGGTMLVVLVVGGTLLVIGKK